MLPESVNRSSSSTTDVKSNTISYDDDGISRQPTRFPTTDFNTHFVIKENQNRTSLSEQVSGSTKNDFAEENDTVPKITVSQSQPPYANATELPMNTGSDLLLMNSSNNVTVSPMPEPTSTHSFLDPYSSNCASQSEFSDKSTGPVTPLTYPFAARRSNTLQHPFMIVSQNLPGTGSGSVRLLETPNPRLSSLAFPDSPMDHSYQPISPFCRRKNKMGEFEKDEEKDEISCKAGDGDSDYETILKVCGQRGPIPIENIFNGLKDIEKIGEGVYGEVYSGTFRYFSHCTWVYKVVAIAGDMKVNGEKQKGFSEVLPEILVSQELSKLKGVLNKCYTDGYAFMKNARIAKGRYPCNLLQSWDRFNEKYESDNDRPEFRADQLYMVLEFEFAGQDIESLNFQDARQTLSIVLQVAHILAVGECALEFEHRDLHWGNILVQTWKAPSVRYLINGKTFNVPSLGIKAAVIDFTISRVMHSKTHVPTYLDLQNDEEQFLGTGDHQFDIYRMMRDHNRNRWAEFCPKSNIYWLHYLANKLYVKGQYTTTKTPPSSRGSTHHIQAIRKLRQLSYTILEHASANDFVLSKECREYADFLGEPTSTSVLPIE